MGKNSIILSFLNIFLQFTLILEISFYFTELNFSINNSTAVNIQLFSWEILQNLSSETLSVMPENSICANQHLFYRDANYSLAQIAY